MMAVLFEVTLAPGREADYLDLAAQLRPLLAQCEGFISIERFQSLSQPDKWPPGASWKRTAWRNWPAAAACLPITSYVWRRWCAITAWRTASKRRQTARVITLGPAMNEVIDCWPSASKDKLMAKNGKLWSGGRMG